MSRQCVPQRLRFRSVFLTLVFMVQNSFIYYYGLTTYNFLEPIDCIMRTSIGTLIGFLIIWLVFPQSFHPKTFKDTFPKIHWVGLFLSFFFIFITFDFFPGNFMPFQVQDGIVPIIFFAFITYVLFFIVLANSMKNQATNFSSSTTV